jgi:hypothetical protein
LSLRTTPRRTARGTWKTRSGRTLDRASAAYWEGHYRRGLTDGRGHVRAPSAPEALERPSVASGPRLEPAPPESAYVHPNYETVLRQSRGIPKPSGKSTSTRCISRRSGRVRLRHASSNRASTTRTSRSSPTARTRPSTRQPEPSSRPCHRAPPSAGSIAMPAAATSAPLPSRRLLASSVVGAGAGSALLSALRAGRTLGTRSAALQGGSSEGRANALAAQAAGVSHRHSKRGGVPLRTSTPGLFSRASLNASDRKSNDRPEVVTCSPRAETRFQRQPSRTR